MNYALWRKIEKWIKKTDSRLFKVNCLSVENKQSEQLWRSCVTWGQFAQHAASALGHIMRPLVARCGPNLPIITYVLGGKMWPTSQSWFTRDGRRQEGGHWLRGVSGPSTHTCFSLVDKPIDWQKYTAPCQTILFMLWSASPSYTCLPLISVQKK